MIQLLIKALEKLLEDLNAGNTNLTEDLALEALLFIKQLELKTYTRTEAADYIHVSVATFDNYRKVPGFPTGTKHRGGVRVWTLKELDEGILVIRKMLLK